MQPFPNILALVVRYTDFSLALSHEGGITGQRLAVNAAGSVHITSTEEYVTTFSEAEKTAKITLAFDCRNNFVVTDVPHSNGREAQTAVIALETSMNFGGCPHKDPFPDEKPANTDFYSISSKRTPAYTKKFAVTIGGFFLGFIKLKNYHHLHHQMLTCTLFFTKLIWKRFKFKY